MKSELVLSGKKEALKHLGRASQETRERLNKLVEQESEEPIHKPVLISPAAIEEIDTIDNFAGITEQDNHDLVRVDDIDNIVPSILPSPHLDLLLQDHNNTFINSLANNFREAQETVSIFSDMFSVNDLFAPEDKYCSALVFTCLQDYVVQMVLKFLKHNKNFTSHTWVSQVKLLKKNLPDITVIILTMFLDKESMSFRWKLCREDTEIIQKVRSFNGVAEIKKADFERHLGVTATKYILEVGTNIRSTGSN